MIIKRYKSLIALILVLTLIFTQVVFASTYSDTVGHWAEQKIEKWSNKGLLKGDGGKFNPNANITRAEMATIIDRIMDYQEIGKNVYTDLSDDWYTMAILKNSQVGVFEGANGKVRPLDTITREEAVIVMCKALNIEPVEGETIFADNAKIASWSKGYVKAFSELGYISGVGDNCFAPKAPIKRASVITMVDNIIAEWINEKGTITEDFEGTVIINSKDVTLDGCTINGDLIIAEGVADGEVILDNVTITGDVYVRGGGENSVYFKNTNVNGTLDVSKSDGKIRIVSSGSTVIKITKLRTGAILTSSYTTGVGFERIVIPPEAVEGANIEIDGNIGKMTVETKGTNITIKDGSKVSAIDITAEGTKLDVDGEVTIVHVKSGAENTSIVGEGDLDKVNVEADNVAITTERTKVTASETAKNVTADGKEVDSGESVTTGKTSSGGSSSGGGSNHAPTVVAGQENQTGVATPAGRDGAPAVDYTIDVNAWFDDIDNNTLTYYVASTTVDESNSIVISGNTLTYTPTEADALDENDENNGKEVFVHLRAYDGTVYTDSNVAIAISVNPIPNNAPTVVSNTKNGVAIIESLDGNTSATPYTATIDDTWFTDLNGDNLTYDVTEVTGADISEVVLNGTNITYTPSIVDASTVTIKIRANDGLTDSDEVEITIAVTIANSAPMLLDSNTAIPDSVYNYGEVITNHNYHSYFDDPDILAGYNDALIYSIAPTLPNGLSLNEDTGVISGTPIEISSETAYTVTVTDSQGATATDTFHITVNPPVQGTKVKNSAGVWDIDNTNGTHIGIWTVEDLQLIDTYDATSNFVYGDDGNYLDENYVLMTNIDFDNDNSYRDKNNRTAYTTGSGFSPIGNYIKFVSNEPFTGTFNGNGYVINNLFINTNNTDSSIEVTTGLFVLMENSTVENLALTNVDITSNNNYVGGVAGTLKDSVIKSCYVTGTIKGTGGNGIGGIVGKSNGGIGNPPPYAKIENCYAIVDITNTDRFGYYSGSIVGEIESYTIVNNCYALGTVNAGDESNYQSGLVGGNYTGKINNSISFVTSVTGKYNAKRLVADKNENFPSELVNSYAYAGMLLNNNTVSSVDATSLHGKDMTIDEFLSADSYDNNGGIDLNWDTSIWNVGGNKRPTLKAFDHNPQKDDGTIDANNYPTPASLPSSISPTLMYGSIVVDIDGAANDYDTYESIIDRGRSTIEFVDNEDSNNNISIILSNLVSNGILNTTSGVITFDGSPIDHYPCLAKSGDFATGEVLENFDMDIHDKVVVTISDGTNTVSGEVNIPSFNDNGGKLVQNGYLESATSIIDNVSLVMSDKLPFDAEFDNSAWKDIATLSTGQGNLQGYVYMPTPDPALANSTIINKDSAMAFFFEGLDGSGGSFIGANRPVVVLIVKDTNTGLMKPYTCYVQSIVGTGTIQLVQLTENERNALPLP